MSTFQRVEDLIVALVTDLTRCDDIDCDMPFVELGLSSLHAVELSDRLERQTGLVLSPTVAYDYPTIRAAAIHLVAELEDRSSDPTTPMAVERIET